MASSSSSELFNWKETTATRLFPSRKRTLQSHDKATAGKVQKANKQIIASTTCPAVDLHRTISQGLQSKWFHSSVSNPKQKKPPYPNSVELLRVQAGGQAPSWSRLPTDPLHRKTEVTKSHRFPNSPKVSRKAEKFVCISLERTSS